MSQITNPRPVTVTPRPNFELEIEFSNGELRMFDLKPYLDFGVFKELKDVRYFNLARIEFGTVTWPHEQDICPDTLYEESRPVSKEGVG